ncbi:type II toxin-antitoxin system VapC family toxin [Candidatus Uhrbacteria bacterium]|nr:type II toxin-antitoxin system VapC family toxin [Candidatus Uhrbacteria bacterium]
MENFRRIFVDSNYFVALFNEKDSLYAQAQTVADLLDMQSSVLVISNFVFLEVVTVLAQRRGKSVSKAAGSYLLNTARIEFVHIDSTLQQDSWNTFQSVSSKNISFVDCSTIAVMKAEGIRTLLTFDFNDFRALQRRFYFTLFNF